MGTGPEGARVLDVFSPPRPAGRWARALQARSLTGSCLVLRFDPGS